MRRSKYFQLGPSAMKEKLKKKLNNRVDQFFNETTRTQGSSEEWMKEYFDWVRINLMKKEQGD